MQNTNTLRFEYEAIKATIGSLQHRMSEIARTIHAEEDFQAGYRDRRAGQYDKWYRRFRADEGAAYDRGVVACVNAGDVDPDEHFVLIECAS